MCINRATKIDVYDSVLSTFFAQVKDESENKKIHRLYEYHAVYEIHYKKLLQSDRPDTTI